MIRLRLTFRSVTAWLVLGLLIREAFSFWTGHPFDTEIWIRNGYYVSFGWNPYRPMPPVPGLSLTYLNQSLSSVSYLPLWSVMLAGLYRFYAFLPGGNRFVFYFLLKQPPILGDVLLGYLLGVAVRRWGPSPDLARRVVALWMVFPYPILISAIWGMFDSMVAALVVAALLVSSTPRRYALLGLGILLKFFPVIFVPHALLQNRGRSRVASLIAVAIPVAFTAVILAVTGWGFGAASVTLAWDVHVFPQGLTAIALTRDPIVAPLLFSNPVWIYIVGYVWIPGILVGSWWISRRIPGSAPRDLVQVFLFLTVVFFLLRVEVNEQYLLYLLPLLLLDVVLWHPERRLLFHMSWVLAFAFMVVNNFFLVRFALPVFPGALAFEDSLAANSIIGGTRYLVLDLLAVLFSIHLIQLGGVVAHPERSTVPWLLTAPRRLWSASVRRMRTMAPGRGE